MSEEQEKKFKLLTYWLFSTVLIVFAAITTYIALWARPAGLSLGGIIWAGFPIWGITALSAAIIFVVGTIYRAKNSH